MSSPHTRWIDATTWICTRHLPSVRMPASAGLCAFSTCDSVRPRRESFDRVANASTTVTSVRPTASVTKKVAVKKAIAKTEAPATETTTTEEVAKCEWFKCNKGPGGTRANSRARSKYCSRACSNSSARYRHKQRAKAKKEE